MIGGKAKLRLSDILLGKTQPEKTADEAEVEIMAEFERLGGGNG